MNRTELIIQIAKIALGVVAIALLLRKSKQFVRCDDTSGNEGTMDEFNVALGDCEIQQGPYTHTFSDGGEEVNPNAAGKKYPVCMECGFISKNKKGLKSHINQKHKK